MKYITSVSCEIVVNGRQTAPQRLPSQYVSTIGHGERLIVKSEYVRSSGYGLGAADGSGSCGHSKSLVVARGTKSLHSLAWLTVDHQPAYKKIADHFGQLFWSSIDRKTSGSES